MKQENVLNDRWPFLWADKHVKTMVPPQSVTLDEFNQWFHEQADKCTKRQNFYERQRRAKQVSELAECTFVPEINHDYAGQLSRADAEDGEHPSQ